MSHHFFNPSTSLQGEVNGFGVIEIEQEAFNQRAFLPDPYPGLVINCGAPLMLVTEKGEQIELPRAFILGLQTKPMCIQTTGAFRSVGMHLPSWGGRLFVDETTDLAAPIIPLSRDWQALAIDLQMTLDQRGEAEAIAVLETMVSAFCNQHKPDISTVRTAVEMLYTTNGQCSIDDLAQRCCISRSQLERRFNYLTGVSPKTLSRIMRFYATCCDLMWNPMDRLTDLAQKFGYTDQAHFIHDFRALAGFTPRHYLAYQRNLLADTDFLQFSTKLADVRSTCLVA